MQYKNVKPDVSVRPYSIQLNAVPESDRSFVPALQYLNAIWNVINFKEAEERVKVSLPLVV